MSHSLPVIASDLPFVKELLKEKDNHFMFSNGNIEELAEAMTKITELPSERLIQMGKVSLDSRINKTARHYQTVGKLSGVPN
mgnify:CR=1 FL=1